MAARRREFRDHFVGHPPISLSTAHLADPPPTRNCPQSRADRRVRSAGDDLAIRDGVSVPRRQFRSRIVAVSWTLSSLCLVVLGGWLVFMTTGELQSLLRSVPPTPPEVSRDVLVTNVEDGMGRRASFRILLFTDEFRWRLN